ncbi:hypothetical protein [uncultured Ferrimonas sp.]|uniref:hypothetical protein n=1 Tax=uncultured Ferrimonas sp. TaxID=432640 RepID=UPI0026141C17|nr:hypothetical protein [uncultured Ferrimonas sp.]
MSKLFNAAIAVVALVLLALLGNQYHRDQQQLRQLEQQIAQLQRLRNDSHALLSSVTQYQVKPAANLDYLSHLARQIQLLGDSLDSANSHHAGITTLAGQLRSLTLKLIRHQIAANSSRTALNTLLNRARTLANSPQQHLAMARLELAIEQQSRDLEPLLTALPADLQQSLRAHAQVYRQSRFRKNAVVQDLLALPQQRLFNDLTQIQQGQRGLLLQQQSQLGQQLLLLVIALLLLFGGRWGWQLRQRLQQSQQQQALYGNQLLQWSQELHQGLEASEPHALARLRWRFSELLQLQQQLAQPQAPWGVTTLDEQIDALCPQLPSGATEIMIYRHSDCANRVNCPHRPLFELARALLSAAIATCQPQASVVFRQQQHHLLVDFEQLGSPWPNEMITAWQQRQQWNFGILALQLGSYLQPLLMLQQLEQQGAEISLWPTSKGSRCRITLAVEWLSEATEISPQGEVAVIGHNDWRGQGLTQLLISQGYRPQLQQTLRPLLPDLLSGHCKRLILCDRNSLSAEELTALRQQQQHGPLPLRVIVLGNHAPMGLEQFTLLPMPISMVALQHTLTLPSAAKVQSIKRA